MHKTIKVSETTGKILQIHFNERARDSWRQNQKDTEEWKAFYQANTEYKSHGLKLSLNSLVS